jgi:predicted transcriptional regulator
MRTISEQFLSRVEAFLAESGLKSSEFGRQSIGDPNLMVNLRRGRSPTLATADKVLAYIEKLELEAANKSLNGRAG